MDDLVEGSSGKRALYVFFLVFFGFFDFLLVFFGFFIFYCFLLFFTVFKYSVKS